MPLELPQIVTELVEAVICLGEVERGQDGLMDFLRRPTPDVCAAMQEHLKDANDACVLDLDTGITDRADGDG